MRATPGTSSDDGQALTAHMADSSALAVPTDLRGTIATRIGEAEERLRSSIAARINRNRAELARCRQA